LEFHETGAIEGYKSGEIGYNSHFTIIYAGKVVDTAPDYASFVTDLQQRLDRYEKAHGPHWIFYEAPLDVHAETKPRMMMSTAELDRESSWTNLGPYYIQQGYWKRSGWVTRMPTMANASPSPQEPLLAKRTLHKTKWVYHCQDVGPKIAFRSILDSGATYPTLFKDDISKLGINETFYGCQSVGRAITANGIVMNRIYELFVCILDKHNRQLVDPNDPVWPYFGKYLGGLCPVVEKIEPILYDENDIEINTRLSGMMPFLACYVSCTPTVDKMFLGEDRKDMTGIVRMPGQRRWAIDLPSMREPGESDKVDNLGIPKVKFTHRGGQAIDEDHPTKTNAR